MFEVMRRMVKNSKKRKPDFQSKLPACLQEMTEKSSPKKFPCTICGKLFPKINHLIMHSHEHGPVRVISFYRAGRIEMAGVAAAIPIF